MSNEELLLSDILNELAHLASGSINEEELAKEFISIVKKNSQVNSAEIIDLTSANTNRFEEYLINTRKTYVDNQLSEYSAFTELVSYSKNGYMSCAIIPLVVNNKVIAALTMLSNKENAFSPEFIHVFELSASMLAPLIAYKTEIRKSSKLVDYFDSAFNSQYPQMLITKENKIIKSNSAAAKLFNVSNGTNATRIFGIDFAALNEKDMVKGINIKINNSENEYKIFSKSINPNLFHVLAVNVTGELFLNRILNALSEGNDMFLLIAKEDLIITSMSKNLEKFIGYNEMQGDLKFDNFLKENNSAFVNLKEGKPFFFELKGISKTLYVKAIPNKIESGYMVLMVDKESDKYISDAEQNIKGFIDGTSDIVIMIDSLGYIRECNMQSEKILGYKREELVERDISEIYSDAKILNRDIIYVKNGGKIDNTYVNIKKKDNEMLPAVHSIRFLRGINEEDRYIIIIKELSTKMKLEEMEDDLKEAEGDIKRLNAISGQKSDFIYNISHELRTPLTNIKGFSSLLYEGNAGELNKDQKDYVNTIIEESNRLMLIIQQVLDAAKLETEKVKLELKEVDLKSLGESPSIKALSESAHGKNLDFSWNVDFNVPQITADPNRLIQVFVNLIGNAIKFTEKGGINIHIYRKSVKYIECDVSDTGIGIAEEDRRKLFRKFYQAQNYQSQKSVLIKQDGAGTGLGLAITKEIIKLHGGSIRVESEPGKGSKFAFVLPITKRTRRKTAKKE